MREETGATDDAADPAPGPPPFRARHPVWWLVSAVLVVAAVALALHRRYDLAAALHLIPTASPPRLAAAALLEALSVLSLAALQRRLLVMGGARLGLAVVTALVVAANAVAGALPGGAAFAAAWQFGQLRRRGVSLVLAGSVLAVSGVLSALALFLLLVAGVLAGGAAGPAGLRAAVLWMAALLVLLAAGAAALSRFTAVRRRAWRVWRRIGVRSRRMWGIEEQMSRLVRRVRATRPGPRPWLAPSLLALANWVLDAACLAACAWALDVALPWRVTLTAYALTQMAGALRLTPGGIGIVETGLAALLVLYGLRPDQAIAVTLLYRIASYWALQPIGWTSWLGLTLAARHARPHVIP
ncbi:lysylphosphatidylglycerol synthase transmembrane domain-containing protein [Streptomyces tropicalis]|uniref:YbhN family protein n=1 Tax=Streptomyces tropicalis TaxID=3034234 RepID=A0ABT6A6F6_9ACTN|nr:YbhN family protein [Streptomyces tropicalis]MDF3300235.1 YbhN family protein [Streptomyces tropicalis]